jgi:hypothetical protein
MLVIPNEVKDLCNSFATLLASVALEHDNVSQCLFSVISCSCL